jgi:hypothetical protein
MRLDSGSFRDFLKAFGEMGEDEKKAALAFAEKECGDLRFIPNPGPQTDAYYSQADELYYGGAGGGGKTRLLCGVAVNEHHSVHIFRRESTQLRGIVKELSAIIGNTDGLNAQIGVWRLDGGQTIELAGVKDEKDKEKWQGREADFKGFDEICHFSRSQYRFIVGWNRSTRPGQRCRVIAAGNPPLTAEGLWVIQEWAAWLDPTHPDPAKPGELRWPVRRNDDDEGGEIFFRTKEEAIAHLSKLRTAPRDYEGNLIPPRSRTHIPALLEDNPDLMRAGYSAVIEAMPKELRDALKGSFSATLSDQPWQCIPTAWIVAAQERWKPDGWQENLMTAMGFDPAGGGKDSAELAPRHGHWYAEIISAQGKETADGSTAAATIIKHRRDSAAVVVDVGGGYGGAVTLRLKDNSIPFNPFNGAHGGVGRTRDRQLGFANKRAQAMWQFREALDPDQPGGSVIALPPDPELRADLAAPTYEVGQRGIVIESKEEIRKRLGRSTGKADAVVMAWSEGNAAIRRGLGGPGSTGWQRPSVQVGHAAKKKGRR